MKIDSATLEYNFDGLVGQTHNYAGLAFGNIASEVNAGSVSSPKQAALQGLEKMRLLMQLGLPQAVIPPQQRPNLNLLRSLGFKGSNTQIIQKAYKYQPALLAACYSAASMWTANMATVSPSCNTENQLVHITPANLTTQLHRAQESDFNFTLLRKIFADNKYFKIHAPLAAYADLSDEGAANHSVLCKDYNNPGLELFVYGKVGIQHVSGQSINFPARQTKLASSTLIRQHNMNENQAILLQQHPKAIDAGVFHNDVIFVANKNLILYHQQAFLDDKPLIDALKKYFADDCHIVKITSEQLSLEEAVATYFFNSQLVSLPNGNSMALILPMECKASKAVQQIINTQILSNTPINQIEYVECRQSMRNGGGPACLRLRVALTPSQQQAMHQGVIMNDGLCTRLEAWVNKHYRDSLAPKDLLDPLLIDEVFVALDSLTKILNLGNIYPFQLEM